MEWKFRCRAHAKISVRYFLTVITFSIFTGAASMSTGVQSGTGQFHDKIVVCTTSTGLKIEQLKLSNENVDFNLCTHLICIDNIWDDTIDPLNPKDGQSEDNYERFTNLRQQYPHLKISLAVKYLISEYEQNAGNKERRRQFVKRSTGFLSRNKFNGLDLVWDFSDFREELGVDKKNILNLMRELKESFQQHNLMLTVSFIAKEKSFGRALDIASLSEYLDYIHFIPKYQYTETWPGSYRVDDVVKDRSISNVHQIVDGLISMGVPSTKLVIGLHFMGFYFNSILDLSLKYATFRRTMEYSDVCHHLLHDKDATWDTMYDEATELAIAKHESNSWRGILRRIRVIVFESSRSVASRVKFALKRELAGAMAITVDMDDNDGNCGIGDDAFDNFNLMDSFDIPDKHNTTQPLLKTINYVFGVAPFEKQARNPGDDDDIEYNAIDKLSEIDSVNGITAKLPDTYKPLIPVIQSVNDAMIVGYDKLHEKSELYKKDGTLLTLLYSMLFQIPKMFIVVFDKMVLA